jgi:predicted DNA-binding helix-hairpin-helix protein
MSLYNAGIVQGFFISSGIVNGGINTQDRLIEVAEILRISWISCLYSSKNYARGRI